MSIAAPASLRLATHCFTCSGVNRLSVHGIRCIALPAHQPSRAISCRLGCSPSNRSSGLLPPVKSLPAPCSKPTCHASRSASVLHSWGLNGLQRIAFRFCVSVVVASHFLLRTNSAALRIAR